MRKIQRDYFPGDKWLYFKIYSGLKTGENILLNILYPFADNLIKKNIIEKWFFIRYSDPEFHIRIRFLFVNTESIGYIISTLNNKLKNLCNDHYIFNISIATYSRELERYGISNMELSESIFYHDSNCICSILKRIEHLDDNYRWIIAFRLLDGIFNAFKFSLKERQEYTNSLDISYKAEFGYTMYNSKQLNSLYRKHKKTIYNILKSKNEDDKLTKVIAHIDKRNKKLQMLFNDHGIETVNIRAIIHMMMNRLFINQNRTHELLIYNFLNRYYISEIAKTTN